MDNICPYITYAEATKSANAIRAKLPNTPDAQQLTAMRAVALMCFVPLREHFQVPIGISSFYRSAKVNALTPGASATSQHCKGEAIDIDADIYPASNITNGAIFRWLRAHVPFDQLIWEYGNDENPDWVHVSHRANGKQRGQVLRKRHGKSYEPWKP